MINDLLQHLEKIDNLIQKQNTGTTSELAGKIGITERSLYYYLKLMKSLNAPIMFCKERRSYYYVTRGGLALRFLPFLPLRESKLHVRKRFKSNN